MLNGKQYSADYKRNGTEGTSSYSAESFQIDDARIQKIFLAKPERYSVKEIVYNEGAEADTVIVIRSGMIKLISHLSNGRARIVRVHSVGSWLGLCGLLGQPYEHTAIAVEDTDVFRIQINEILRIKSENPHLYCRLIERWFNYLQEADLWISEFSTGNIKGRVARLVNFLSEIENKALQNEVKLLTCEEMAEILGATPESVSRVLAEFKRQNILFSSRLHTPDVYKKNVNALDSIAQN